MPKYRFTIDVDVDDEALAAHDSEHKPPPDDVDAWYQTDIIEAVNQGIAEVDHAEPVLVENLDEAD